MNTLYIIGGVAVILFGLWQTIYVSKRIARKGLGILGADIKLLGVGVACIIGGIIVVAQHI